MSRPTLIAAIKLPSRCLLPRLMTLCCFLRAYFETVYISIYIFVFHELDRSKYFTIPLNCYTRFNLHNYFPCTKFYNSKISGIILLHNIYICIKPRINISPKDNRKNKQCHFICASFRNYDQ